MDRPRDAADVRVASNGASPAEAPQCGQNRLPSGTGREQAVHVIGGGAYTPPQFQYGEAFRKAYSSSADGSGVFAGDGSFGLDQ